MRQNIDALSTQIDAPAPVDLLDLGCGPGREVAAFMALGHRAGLLQWRVVSAQVAGRRSIRLELRADNPVALAFHGRLRFSETRLVPGYCSGRIAARCMARALASDAGPP